jgi:protein O-GlcNAc transferase
MGCPVVTLSGDSFASRVTTSLVANAGLPELAAVSPARYEELIIELGRDASQREALRDRLEHATSTLPLFDSTRLTRNLERAYAQMAANAVAGTTCGFDLH